MAISAAWSKARTVKRKRNCEQEDMSSSRFMGATGPLGPPPAAMAYAGMGDLVRPRMRNRIGGNMVMRFLRSEVVLVIVLCRVWTPVFIWV